LMLEAAGSSEYTALYQEYGYLWQKPWVSS
jgi:hypothetical protein